MDDQDKPKKKKRVNSKGKGSGFENSIAKLLGTHLSPMKFRRSQSSGAILGGKNKKFMEQFSEDAMTLFIGDVVPTNEADVARELGWKVKFAFECKFYQSPDSIEHLFEKTRIVDWYLESVEDAKKINKQPLLIFKFNHCSTYCATELKYQPHPSTLTTTLTIIRTDHKPIELIIFKLEDALKDLSWWKKTLTNKDEHDQTSTN